MNRLNKILRLSLFVFIYTFGTLQSAYGDDTEIFLPPTDTYNASHPNILFIFDTSGSMGSAPSGSVSSSNPAKIDIVKDVMDSVLTQLTNVNVGLMSFNSSNPGIILNPVWYIDKVLNDALVSQPITLGANDGQEPTQPAEPAPKLPVSLTDQTLNINGVEYVAVRFEDLNIPQGAIIDSASVTFSASGNTSGLGTVSIFAEDVDSSQPLGNQLFSARDKTTATTTWGLASWTDRESISTPDISSVIQEVTSRAAWCGGNDLTLLFEKVSGAGRTAFSKEGVDLDPEDPDKAAIVAPTISITYSSFISGATKCVTESTATSLASDNHDFEVEGSSYDGVAGDLNFNEWVKQTCTKWKNGKCKNWVFSDTHNDAVGLVFQNVNIPQGKTIKSAYISFSPVSSTEVTTTDIMALDANNVVAPSSSSHYQTLYTTSKTASISWSMPNDWSSSSPTRDTPELKSIVQQVISRPGWTSGNNMGFLFKASGATGDHTAKSNNAKLHISYEATYNNNFITQRSKLKTTVSNFTPEGWTPVSGTFEEAGRYFRGEAVKWGLTRAGSSSRRVSHPDSYTGGTLNRDPSCTDANLSSSACKTEYISGSPIYTSPVVDACAPNFVLLLTDGDANKHQTSTETTYKSWTGETCSKDNYTGSGGYSGDDCSEKMAGFFNTVDIHPHLAQTQRLITHTIGFGNGITGGLMQQMAANGGGKYYPAADKDALITALTSFVNEISKTTSTFVTTGVTVNQLNRTTHNEQLYFSLFSPAKSSIWPGNVKRYSLIGGVIKDSDGDPAVDNATSLFKEGAKSYWSSYDDGSDVLKGGVLEKFTTSRNVYTNLGTDDLSGDDDNLVTPDNALITISGATASHREKLLYWAMGYDVDNLAFDSTNATTLAASPTRKEMGDPLHSQPTLIQYNSVDGGGVTSTKTSIFVGSNQGYLHSFDADNGIENWSFIPENIINQKLDSIYTNQNISPSVARVYGMDGSASIYLKDLNGNGAVDSGDSAYLYIGQRRGGDHYYAFDVSEYNNPKFMFEIKPDASYTKLGQTWSTPTITKMNVGVHTDKLVMIFGAGYDTAQDDIGASSPVTKGNAIYIADALTGTMLWSSDSITATPTGAGNVSTMSSVPANVTAFDADSDGLIDHIYATDTKAQIFRFDVKSSDGSITGGRIAHLQDDGTSIDSNRRFYYTADVALIRSAGESFMSVSIGSGFRAHPLNTETIDHFYVIKDYGVITKTFGMDASLSDLQNVTSMDGVDTDGNSTAVRLLNERDGDGNLIKKGWYINFATGSGEKVISRSITFNNAVYFTTYLPPGAASADVCSASAGNGRLYAMNILNGNPFVNLDNSTGLDETDRYSELVAPGIAPEPKLIYDENLEARLCVGLDCYLDGKSLEAVPQPTPGLKGLKWRKLSN